MKSGLKFSLPVWVHSVVFYGTSLVLKHPRVRKRERERERERERMHVY